LEIFSKLTILSSEQRDYYVGLGICSRIHHDVSKMCLYINVVTMSRSQRYLRTTKVECTSLTTYSAHFKLLMTAFM